ncbi:MAG: hypothetical protein DI570_18265 [Phenylobacterium zucineum]|nr:MAG: hypothetical protein DI570_18265 [Phenylobacterium zucineum]
MSPAASVLSVRGLTKRFGASTVLESVDLDIPGGAFACLIGPSGCGKTTCLRILAGLEAPSDGVVLNGGRDLTQLSAARRGVGMIFQSYALFPNMTVGGNVMFGMRLRTAAERRRRAGELLELVGLSHLADRRPTQLSGGQQQRVAIARALGAEPRILLLDEPLSALDPQVREHLRGELRALQRRMEITTVMVTHDQAEALAIADQITVLRAGRVEQTGSPSELYERPANAFVGGFLGAMNHLPARVLGPGRVGFAGGGVLAAPTDGWAAGDRVGVGVRPEALVIDSDAGRPGLVGRVVSREFLGPVRRLKVRLDGHEQLVLADVPTRLCAPPDGAIVTLHAQPRDVLLFSDEAVDA